VDGTIIATLLETASVTVLFLAWKSITEGAFSIPRSMKITSQISWLREHPLILLFSSPQNLGKTNIRPVVPYPPRGTARLLSAPPFLSLLPFVPTIGRLDLDRLVNLYARRLFILSLLFCLSIFHLWLVILVIYVRFFSSPSDIFRYNKRQRCPRYCFADLFAALLTKFTTLPHPVIINEIYLFHLQTPGHLNFKSVFTKHKND